MAVDRRALRKFPGRKRVGGRRRRPNPSTRQEDRGVVHPVQSVAERLGFAVSYKQLVDADTLLKAFEYDQAKLFRAIIADRRVRIQAIQAIFVLMGVDQFDGIKKIVWTYIDKPPVWQFLADSGWSDCDVATQEALTDAERTGLDSVDLRFRSWRYQYSLTSMTQLNSITGTCRALRRRSPWSTSPPLPRWQYETRSGWYDFDLEGHRSLAEALRDAEGDEVTVVRKVMRGVMYELDFVDLTQKNLSTGRVRALRFGTSSAGRLARSSERP